LKSLVNELTPAAIYDDIVREVLLPSTGIAAM